jgi:hypothetical protein
MAHAYEHDHVDEEHEPVVERATPASTVVAGSAVPNIVRLALSLVGAAGMMVGAFLTWAGGTVGTSLPVRVFYRTTFSSSSTFLSSAGAVMILLGLIAVLGIAMWGGWLTRVAGALGIIAFVLVVISMGRSSGFSLPADIGVGLWVALAGGVIALIGGFFAARPIVVRDAAD